jgi:hypothetical protein
VPQSICGRGAAVRLDSNWGPTQHHIITASRKVRADGGGRLSSCISRRLGTSVPVESHLTSRSHRSRGLRVLVEEAHLHGGIGAEGIREGARGAAARPSVASAVHEPVLPDDLARRVVVQCSRIGVPTARGHGPHLRDRADPSPWRIEQACRRTRGPDRRWRCGERGSGLGCSDGRPAGACSRSGP